VIGLDDVCPTHLHRLVESLEDHVGNLPIFLSHLSKEALRLIYVIEGSMVMPIDDHVNPLGDGSVNNCNHLRLFVGRLLQVASMLDCHRCADECALPIVDQEINSIRIPELRLPLGPEKGHASKLDSLAMLVDDLVALHSQFSMKRNWGTSRWPIVGRRQHVAAPALTDLLLPALLHALGPARVLVEARLSWIVAAHLLHASSPIEGAAWLQAGPLLRQAALRAIVLSHDHHADVVPRRREILVRPAARSSCARPEGRGGLKLVRDSPIGVGDVVFIQEGDPLSGRLQVQGAVAAGVACTPLSHHQGGAIVHRDNRFVTQAAFVCSSIEMQRVGQVAACNWVGGGRIYIL